MPMVENDKMKKKKKKSDKHFHESTMYLGYTAHRWITVSDIWRDKKEVFLLNI